VDRALARISPPVPAHADNPLPGFREAKEKAVEAWERDFIIAALRSTNGNVSRAAERVGMYRQSFQQKMRELGVTVESLGLGGS
ncbi:MAG TPA: helix-turn-helix domain-containing protein, partial [Candidatus Binataceae bacterium]|nr:helix-turn-helix domain-containing protein [Candidatus Binataceae bacterium]